MNMKEELMRKDHEMHKLKEMLEKEEEKYRRAKQIVDTRLSTAPKGTLGIMESNRNTQFVQFIGKNEKRKYIKKEQQVLANALAQKSYDQKVKKIVDKRLKQLGSLSKAYKNNEIEEIYDRLNSVRKTLVEPVIKPWEQTISEWKSIPYVGKAFDPKATEIYTKKGERVRSKSEKILADTFFELGLEYKYECPIVLKGFGVVYPDFTFLRKRDGREVYWEHEGRMDEQEYSEKAIRKLNTYALNNILPSDNLILTFETSKTVLNDKVVKIMIAEYLL